jgi:hypothetical protein
MGLLPVVTISTVATDEDTEVCKEGGGKGDKNEHEGDLYDQGKVKEIVEYGGRDTTVL